MSFRNWTMAEVAAHNERVRFAVMEGKLPATALSSAIVDPVQVESELHADILEECHRRGWIALHGSMAARTHRTLGEWDFVILADNGRVLLVECKAKAGKLTADQAALHAWARKLGHQCWVVRSMEEFQKAITMEPI